MTYFSVENTDHNIVHQFKSITDTPIIFKISQLSDYRVTLDVDRVTGENQKIFISSTTPLKIFGFSMNISETYDARNALEEVKYLIELSRFKMKNRKNDSKIVEW